MKKLTNKGFTLVELLAVLVILALISAIATVAYTRYYNNAKDKLYSNYEDGMKEAAMTYIMDTGDAPTQTTNLRLTLKYLVGEEDNGRKAKKPYIDYFKNPRNIEDKCIDGSYVEVNLAEKIEIKDGKKDNNKRYEYKVCLVCNDYKTEGC